MLLDNQKKNKGIENFKSTKFKFTKSLVLFYDSSLGNVNLLGK